jgi:tetratricopeptide (TPR) repeat protein
LAASSGQVGQLGLLALEASEFMWASEAWRLIGRRLFDLKAYVTSRSTWERLCLLNPMDNEANLILGTIYQRTGNVNASDQALKRVLDNRQAGSANRAEALSLLGRNTKDRWRASWLEFRGEAAPTQALKSPYLQQTYERYNPILIGTSPSKLRCSGGSMYESYFRVPGATPC